MRWFHGPAAWPPVGPLWGFLRLMQPFEFGTLQHRPVFDNITIIPPILVIQRPLLPEAGA